MKDFTGKLNGAPVTKITEPKRGSVKYRPKDVGTGWRVSELKPGPVVKVKPPGVYSLSGGDADTAKKLARIAAIKKAAALNNKKYNVRTDTAPVSPSSASAVAPILYGGTGGGGYYGSAEMVGNGGFSLSDIPSIVWIVLAVGVGWFLISSSGGKGKGKGKFF